MGNNQSSLADVPVYYKAGFGVSLYNPVDSNGKLRNRKHGINTSESDYILKGNLKNRNGLVGSGADSVKLNEQRLNELNSGHEVPMRNCAPDLSQLRIEIDESGFVEDDGGDANADRLSNSLKGNFSPTSLCEKNLRFLNESCDGLDTGSAKIDNNGQWEGLKPASNIGASSVLLTPPSEDNSSQSHPMVTASERNRSQSTKSDVSDIRSEIADLPETDEEQEQLSPLPLDKSPHPSPRRLCPQKLKLKLNEIAAQSGTHNKSNHSSYSTSPESQSCSNKRPDSSNGEHENSISGISSPELELLNSETTENPVIYASTFNNLEDEIHGVEDEFESISKEIQALSSKYSSLDRDPASEIFQEIFQRYPSIRVRQAERGFNFNPADHDFNRDSRQNSEAGDGSIDLSWDLENVLDMVYSEGSESVGHIGSRESTPGSVKGHSLNMSALDGSVNCQVDLDGSLYEDELHLHLGSRPLPRIEEHLVESGCKDTDPIYQKMGNSESAYSINPSTSEDISTNPDSGSQAPTSPGVSSPDAEMGEGRLTDASDSLSSNEGKSSRSRTPYTKTPLLILEDENRCKLTVQEKKPTTLPPLQDRKLSLDKSKKGKRNFLIPELQPRVASFHRRRKARARKTIRKAGDKLSANTDGDSDKDLVATETKQGSSLSAVQTTSSLRQNSSSLLVSKGSSHKDQSDSPRNKALSRGGVHKRSRLDKRQKTDGSKQEITVKNLTSEEKRQEVLDNFRRMVRLLIHVRVLLNVSRIRISEEEKSKEFKRFDDGKEISFDPTAFKSTVTYGGLPARARIVLKKTPSERTEEDARVLNDLMARLPVFSKYPKSVKKSLAKTMWYDMFQDGRVILKQGDPGSRMYFVVSGEVELHRTDVVDTGEFIRYHLQTMSAGSTFGEIALMRNMRREFTAVCKGTSEFLSLSKDEFNQALRYRLERDCNIRYDFLRSCDLFKDWTDKQLQICADSSEIKEYKNNMVIAGDTNGPSDGVYFVRRGLCDIVRRIVLVRHQSPYLRPNILLPQTAAKRQNFLNKTYSRGRRLRRDEVRFITVTTLQPGNYFGAGENLRDTFILSRGNTDCVVINPAQFSIQGKSEQLRRMKRSRDRDLPNNNVLYAEFQNNRKWHEYRNQLIHDIIERKKNPHVGRIEDVPRSILNKPAIPADLIYFKSVSNSLN